LNSRCGVNGFAPPSAETIGRSFPERELWWYYYAEHWLKPPLGRFLDYGCGKALFAKRVIDHCDECWCADVDPAQLRETAVVPGVQLQQIDADRPLPFPDESFDTCTILEVIEHVADERRTLRELARVLKPGGRLLLTTPHRGMLTFIDPGNIKFILPAMHRFAHRTLLRNSGYYEARFGDARRDELNLVGDFSLDRIPWHRHYSVNDIRRLAPRCLRIRAARTYYPAMRALWTTVMGLRVATRGRVSSTPFPLRRASYFLSRRESPYGDQLVVLFEKEHSRGER